MLQDEITLHDIVEDKPKDVTKKKTRAKSTKPKMYKCKGECGQKYYMTVMEIHNNQKYCSPCLQRKLKNTEDRITLYTLIQDYYQVTYVTSMHLAQLKNVLKHGYTYEDVINALHYTRNVKGTIVNPSFGLGYVTNNIEAAKHYYKEKEKQNELNNMILREKHVSQNVVTVTKLNNVNTFAQSKTINLEDIL